MMGLGSPRYSGTNRQALAATYAALAGTVLQPTADELALTIKARNNAPTVRVETDNTDNYSTVSLYPPDNDCRARLQWWDRPYPNHVKRPLSIETHGFGDLTSQNPGADNHVTFYSVDSAGASKKVIEWTWGTQWDGILKVENNMRVFGTLEVSGANGMRHFNNVPLSWHDSGATARRVVNVSASNTVSLGDVDGGFGGAVVINAATAGSVRLRINNADVAFVSTARLTLADAVDLHVGSTTGTKIGASATQKLGFYGATPVVRPAGVAVTEAGIHAALVTLGLIAA